MQMEPDFDAPPPSIVQKVEPDSCIKILLATDNHIGYAEGDPVRGRDSINTFREILQLAVANDVDMLLLAGDLFHENRPSRTALYQTIAALREFTMGPRPVSLELVSDEGIGIARTATWPGVNYEDENINVGLPVFSIHGNHDDPQGTGAEGALCALDLLSASGLINYFGRLELPGLANDDEEALATGLTVKPVLLQKGDTKLALYGMGNIRDERFHFEMAKGRIRMFKPAEMPEEWFNILLVHQNRVPHGPKNFVSDGAYGDEADLVVWGHEHDCINQACAVQVTGRNYYISQPGSSIATSLAKGEAIPKHVALVKVQGKEFEMEPIRLRSVRPFVWDEVNLLDAQEEDDVDLSSKLKVNKFLKKKVNELIERANAEWDELHPDGDPDERLLPLIRLRVDHSGGPTEGGHFEIGNPQRFGHDFVDRVANPRDIVQFHRRAQGTRKSKVEIDKVDLTTDDLDDVQEGLGKVHVSTLVHQYLQAQNLGVLSEAVMQTAVDDYVDKGDKDALANMLKKMLKHEMGHIAMSGFVPSKDGPEYDNMEGEMLEAKKSATSKYGSKNKGKGKQRDEDKSEQDEEEDEEEDYRAQDSMDDSDGSTAPTAKKGKSKAAAKPTAKKPAPKGKQKLFEPESELESDEDFSEASAAPKKKAPVKKATTTTKKAAATPAPKKAPARAAATKKAAATQVDTDSESESSVEEIVPKRRKRA